MSENRAKEFLLKARYYLQYPLTRNRKTAQLYVDLAITELDELLETVDALTDGVPAAMGETPRGAVVMLSARNTTPAMLVENSRAALPGAK